MYSYLKATPSAPDHTTPHTKAHTTIMEVYRITPWLLALTLVATITSTTALILGTDLLLPAPLSDVVGLCLRATRELVDNLRDCLHSMPGFITPWSSLCGVVCIVVLYYGYKIFWAPMNRVILLGDIGYADDGSRRSKRDIVNLIRKENNRGDMPPVFPNGWFSVLESRDLDVGQVKNINVLGLSLAVFRGESGTAQILDTTCPHLGANLAVGGRVIGDCLECPFHAWTFRGEDGKCVRIPTTDKIPDLAKVKAYNTLEQNGFIYVWYHIEGIEPTWTPPILDELMNGEWAYCGRAEHELNAHIEEVPENGADLAHLGHLHIPLFTAGTDLRYIWNRLWDFGRHQFLGAWEQDPENKHIGVLQLTHCLRLFGIHLSFLDMKVLAKQIGPGIVYMTFSCVFGQGAYLQSLTPQEPLVQRSIHHAYMTWWLPPFVGKFFLYAEAVMFERDIMIWNNKKYMKKPMYVRCKEDALIATHRHWYSQFYSENSPRLTFQKQTLDW